MEARLNEGRTVERETTPLRPAPPKPADPVKRAAPTEPSIAAPPTDDESGAPIGPGAEEEAAFLATQTKPLSAPPQKTEREPPPAKLPALEGLVSRIPQEVREALDDLFRAKFTTVRQLPAKTLK